MFSVLLSKNSNGSFQKAIVGNMLSLYWVWKNRLSALFVKLIKTAYIHITAWAKNTLEQW